MVLNVVERFRKRSIYRQYMWKSYILFFEIVKREVDKCGSEGNGEAGS